MYQEYSDLELSGTEGPLKYWYMYFTGMLGPCPSLIFLFDFDSLLEQIWPDKSWRKFHSK